MIKAVFMDYTGTTLQEGGPDMQKLVKRICQNSSLKDPKKAVELWWRLLKDYEEKSYGDNYMDENQVVDCILKDLQEQIGLEDNLEELHQLVTDFWVYAPAFPDTEEFLKKCPLPVYIISNNGAAYVERGLKDKGFTCAGIISGDMVRAYKPHRELFDRALQVSGCRADQVIHVGDSYASDVQGARAAGIRPVLVDRSGQKRYPDVETVSSLTELLPILEV
ncbi:MAG TPA: HAD family hydrolase [Candidatus Egerieimonas intestinavium]|uniref:HAD family hydrolase n=1 Tax=Candidatus Egerieimonas intestinavium TaxID=2840777 RepID=A0A9D1JFX7_9FIRM|nr:HAD family hydrolase [Candidatus Egerieimonas intestinavium]